MPSMPPYPHFLGIGAQRAGTTWLHDQLAGHRQLWLPPIKELHHFDVLDPHHYSKPRRYRRDALRRMKALIYRRQLPSRWDLAFLTGRQNRAWYQGLFRAAAERGLITGEITPAYAILSEVGVREVRETVPHAKLIYILRNPVDRTWSQTVRVLGRQKGRKAADIPESEIVDFLNTKNVVDKSGYVRSIDTWLGAFDRDQLHVAFFDRIELEPAQLLADIATFLGVDPKGFTSAADDGPRNSAARGQAMPVHVEAMISRLFIDELRQLDERFGSFASQWHERAKGVL